MKVDFIINVGVDVKKKERKKRGKLCLRPWPPAVMMVSTLFPEAAAWVYLRVRAGGGLGGAHSETGSEAGSPLKQRARVPPPHHVFT